MSRLLMRCAGKRHSLCQSTVSFHWAISLCGSILGDRLHLGKSRLKQHVPLRIDCLVSPPYMENTLVVRRPERDDCLVVDPGFEPEQIIEFLRRHELTPAAILLTHGHVDHIAGNWALRNEWPELPILIGRNDAPMLSDPVANTGGLGGATVRSPPADRLLAE